ncbi:MAG: nucleotide sugar dehydrogenase [bacterium]
MSYSELLKKIESKTAHVAVMGQGYVGLPLAMEVTHSGYHCLGVDVSARTVDAINRGVSHILDVTSDELNKALATGRYRASANYADIANADVVSICVPTPLRKTKDPDVSYIQASVAAMRPHLKRDGVLIILESTTYPGTTDELVADALAGEGLVLDENLFVAFSPERVDPGNPTYGLKNTPKVVGGVTPRATDLIAAFYRQVVDHVHTVRSAREAEMVKLLENTFRAVNIALVNEMLLMCDRMGIDMWDVIQAASTKPFGFMPFYPGPGIGGHCIPLDPTYLSWKAKSYGFYNRFIELATDINGNMPCFVVQKPRG